MCDYFALERDFVEIASNFRWHQISLLVIFQLPPQDHVVTVSENMQLYPPEHYLNGHLLEFEYDEEVSKHTKLPF